MKFRLLIALLTVTFSLCLGCQTNKQAISSEMAEVLSKRRLNKWEMDTAGMEQRGNIQEEKPGDEAFILPEQRRVSDVFLYRVIVRKSEHRFWIERGGGVAGVTVVFGPAEIGN